MTRSLTRRQFNGFSAAALGASAMAGFGAARTRAAAAEITVLNWKGYGTDESFALKDFAAKTGITVKHDYFNSEPEMLTKLRTNPGAYDVVLINSARTSQAQAEGLIDAIDLATIGNAKDLAPALKGHSNFMAGGKPYGCAWLWGINSLAVRHGKVTDATSFKIFADPKYAGRLALLDDTATEIGVGALLTGQDINNPKDLNAVKDVLKSLKPNVKLLWSSEDEWNKAFAADAFDISIYWSGSCMRSKKTLHLPVDFVIPKEGAIGWLDGLSLPSSSTKKEAGLKFINYMIDPEFYDTWAKEGAAPASANTVAMAKLPDDDLSKQVHKPEYLTSLQIMSALPDDRRQAFNDVWEEVKASYAK